MVEELDLDAAADEPVTTIEPHQHQPLTMPENRVAPPSRARRTKRFPSPTGGKQLENPDLSIGSYQQNTPEDDEYAVEFVFARRWNVAEDRFGYLVKWQDYDHGHDPWEPRSNFISADGGLALRFVEFLDANPNFDDDHHGMPRALWVSSHRVKYASPNSSTICCDVSTTRFVCLIRAWLLMS